MSTEIRSLTMTLRGKQLKTSSMAPPTPAEIAQARSQVGLTQAQAAALAGYGAQSRWAELEAGTRRMPPQRWAYFLHRAGLVRMPF